MKHKNPNIVFQALVKGGGREELDMERCISISIFERGKRGTHNWELSKRQRGCDGHVGLGWGATTSHV